MAGDKKKWESFIQQILGKSRCASDYVLSKWYKTIKPLYKNYGKNFVISFHSTEFFEV